MFNNSIKLKCHFRSLKLMLTLHKCQMRYDLHLFTNLHRSDSNQSITPYISKSLSHNGTLIYELAPVFFSALTIYYSQN